ncbi:MAG: F0F1 ATP synthase subunit B [Planctomycetota bacterium]|jgi:F-type H+-transporting ATPase subunit b
MKPIAKKSLMVIGVLYTATVTAMITNFVMEGRPEHPAEVSQRVREELNRVHEWAYSGDREHIRERPLTDAEASRIFEEHFIRPGTMININYTIVMQCLNFAILLFILYGWLWDPMLQFLDRRRALIRDRLEEAARNRDEAGELRRQRLQELDGLRRDRGQVLEQAEALGEQERKDIVERARREAERVMTQAEERLREQSRRARVALREEVADLAVRIASEMLKRELSPQDHAELIQEVTRSMALSPGGEAAAEGGGE